ncbi:MAG: ABC transporter permease subunit [Gemmataceae bacterium]
MTRTLFLKLLRDVRFGLIAVCALLFLFEMLWARVTHTISVRILENPTLRAMKDLFESVLFQGPGQVIKVLMGGDIDVTRALDTFSIGFVHPVVQIILCVWAIGRSSGALAGELDRGTMELLLAQPVPRSRLVLAHLLIECLAIPALCLSMFLGSMVGLAAVGLLDHANPDLRVDPLRLAPALLSHAFLLFAISGLSIFISALGRFRSRVLGIGVISTLLMFLLNVLAQLWGDVAFVRPYTVFYYFDPQTIILHADWARMGMVWLRLGVLLGLGSLGYAAALLVFSRRDLPAPL